METNKKSKRWKNLASFPYNANSILMSFPSFFLFFPFALFLSKKDEETGLYMYATYMYIIYYNIFFIIICDEFRMRMQKLSRYAQVVVAVSS